MREILFRGKWTTNGQWVEGFYIADDMENPNPYIVNTKGKYRVAHKSVGQYTRLRDKNGKRIFEGDVVTFKTRVGSFKPHYVRWYEEEARFVVTGKDGVRSYPMDRSFEYEVIGNIHDNPELLKGEGNG